MRIAVGSESLTVHELWKRLENDETWIKVFIPAVRAGMSDDRTERANWAEEMIGRCGLSETPGGAWIYDPDADWVAIQGRVGQTYFYFKDPDLASAFRLARG